jgi:hypothetical protein
MSVEVDRSTNLGINFAILNNRNGTGQAMFGNGVALTANAGYTPAKMYNKLTGKLNGIPGLGFLEPDNSFKYGFINNTTTGFMQALEQVGEVNVLASPRVLVLNKQRAEIQLGQRLGYFTVTQNLTSTVQQVQFLNTGTLLRFRPFVSNDGMIRMEVHPEKSTGSVANNVPNLNTSEVTTNVMVPNGATIVIGGLIENNDASSQQGTLGLSRLPVVGPLFRAKTQDSTKRELIVLLTPRIWNPAGLVGAAPPGAAGPGGAACPPSMIGLATPPDANAAAIAANTPNDATRPPAPAAEASHPLNLPLERPAEGFFAPGLGPGASASPTTPSPTPPAPDAAPAPAPNSAPRAAPTSLPPIREARAPRPLRDDAIVRTSGESQPRRDEPDVDPGHPRHIVRPGDTFNSIAERYYGSRAYARALWSANRRVVPAPDRLRAGMSLVVPPADSLELSSAPAPAPAATRTWQPAGVAPVRDLPKR